LLVKSLLLKKSVNSIIMWLKLCFMFA